MLDHTLKSDVAPRRLEVITETGRRGWFSKDDKARIVEETLLPGAVVSEIARRHGLTSQQVFTWRRQARRSPATIADDPQCVPAVVDAMTPAAAAGHFSAGLQSGGVLRMAKLLHCPSDEDALVLHDLLALLQWRIADSRLDMLPNNSETPNSRRLQDIVKAAAEENVFGWPGLTEEEYARVGRIIVYFSHIDFNIRRIVDDFDDAGLLQPPWKGRSKKLRMFEAEEALKTILTDEPNKTAMERMSVLRGLRNLLAHFGIRRIPDEDAFLFFGKSAADYKQVFGGDADPSLMLTAVLEAPTLTNALKEVHGLQDWIATAASQFATQLSEAKLITR